MNGAKNVCRMALLAVLSIGLAASYASAGYIVEANFTDGNGTTSYDQYEGIAGGGWDGAWVEAINRSTMAGNVTSTTPLDGGGNYLDVLLTAGSIGRGQAVVNRSYNTGGTIDMTEAHTVAVKYRLDDTDLSGFTSGDDRLFVFDDITSVGPSASSPWAIGVWGAPNAYSGNAVAGKWAVYDGNSHYTDTGVSLAVDTIYDFTIDLDPVNSEYSVTIDDGGGSPVTMSGLAFRSGTSLHGRPALSGYASAIGETRNFSFDSLTVSQVPEPATLTLLYGGLLSLLAYVWRKRK